MGSFHFILLSIITLHSAGNVLSLLNISSAVLSLSPISAERNTNHSDLSRLRSLRIITAIELISRRSEYCHRSGLSDRRGTSLFYRKSLVHRAAGVRKSFPDGCRSDKIIIDCLIIVPINRDIVSFSYHNLPIFWSSTLIKLSYKSKPLVF